MTPSDSSSSFRTALSTPHDSDESTTSSWAHFFWNSVSWAWSPSKSFRHIQCLSADDTTSDHDLKRFETAASALMETTRSDAALYWKSSPYTEIPLCRQRESWDCGVACLQMILAWLRNDDIATCCDDKERQWMLDTLGTQSIWTIDLILVFQATLQKHDLKCAYLLCSKTLGVNREHHSLHYYTKAFGSDEIRVNDLFAKAADMGLPMLRLSHLGLAQVIRFVSQPHIVAIVLLDSSVLRRKTTYAGHYVVLCGVSCDPAHVQEAKRNDPKSQDDYCMVVKNPGRGIDTNFVTPSLLEKAWRAKGTDDDIIFIAKPAADITAQDSY